MFYRGNITKRLRALYGKKNTTASRTRRICAVFYNNGTRPAAFFEKPRVFCRSFRLPICRASSFGSPLRPSPYYSIVEYMYIHTHTYTANVGKRFADEAIRLHTRVRRKSARSNRTKDHTPLSSKRPRDIKGPRRGRLFRRVFRSPLARPRRPIK